MNAHIKRAAPAAS